MTQPLFNFPYHSVTHSYPKGTAFQFGKGYQFNVAPQLPVQRVFKLHFNAMQWFVDAQGNADATQQPQINILTLIQFYEAQRTNVPFTYNHPVYGALTVCFSADQTFETPKTVQGSLGVTEGFDIFFVEQLL